MGQDHDPSPQERLAERVRDRRVELRLTQNELAKRVGRSLRWVTELENGRGDPTLFDLKAVADVLERSVEWLLHGLFEGHPRATDAAAVGKLSSREDEDTRRRTFNRLAIATLMGAVTGTIDLERISWATHRAVDTSTLDDLTLVTDSYARQWKILPPGILLPNVDAHLRMVTSLKAREDRKLHAVGADTAVLAGYLAFQLEDRGRANTYWTIARSLAVEVGGETWARAQIALSALHSGLAHGAGEASVASVELLDDAERAAGPTASRLLRAWIRARRAEEYAALENRDAAEHDLEAADSCLRESAACSDAIVGPADFGQLDGFIGHSAVLLGRHDDAVMILHRSLDSMSNDMIAWRSVIHCDLAAALAAEREVDEACRMLEAAYGLASEVGATEHIQRVRGIRRRLEPYADSRSVRHLDDRLGLLS